MSDQVDNPENSPLFKLVDGCLMKFIGFTFLFSILGGISYVAFDEIAFWILPLFVIGFALLFSLLVTLEDANTRAQIRKKPIVQFKDIGFEEQNGKMVGIYQGYAVSIEVNREVVGGNDVNVLTLQVLELSLKSPAQVSLIYKKRFDQPVFFYKDRAEYRHILVFKPSFEQLTYRIEDIIKAVEEYKTGNYQLKSTI